MNEKDFEKGFEFLKRTVKGSGAEGTGFGPGEFGFTVDPGNLSIEKVKDDFFRLENNDTDWRFEKGDVVFVKGVVEDGLNIFIHKLSPELIEKTKERLQWCSLDVIIVYFFCSIKSLYVSTCSASAIFWILSSEMLLR